MTRRIGVVTGNRADYGHVLPILEGIRADRDLRLSLFVTGTHLLKEFGRTANQLGREALKRASVLPSPAFDDSPRGLARGAGRMVMELATSLSAKDVDIVLLLGDRPEMLAGAVAATYLRIPIGHVHGGEHTGHVDEPVRHAISRLAHVHFAATGESGARLARMGEEKSRIHVVGAPRLDLVFARPRKARVRVFDEYALDARKPLIVVIQHPTAKDWTRAGVLCRRTLEAVRDFDANLLAFYPNGDPGSREIIRVLRDYERRGRLRVFRSLPEDSFLDLLSAASVLVGNSSAGIIEASALGLPAVNIGDRQEGRQRARNVIDAPHTTPLIRACVERALLDGSFRRGLSAGITTWGDGHATDRIVKTLKSVPLDASLLEKRLTL